ncbi:unnamed protein product [Prunus armeniaca]
MNDRLQYLKIGGDLEDALCNEVDQINSSPFTAERYAFWHDDRITAKDKPLLTRPPPLKGILIRGIPTSTVSFMRHTNMKWSTAKPRNAPRRAGERGHCIEFVA